MKKNKFKYLLVIVVCFFTFHGQNAFAATLLSDTFDGTTIDTTKWIENDSASGGTGGTSGNVQQNNVLTQNGNDNWGDNALKSTSVFDRSLGDITIDTDVTINDCSSSQTAGGIGYGNPYIADNPGDSYIVAYNSGTMRFFWFHNGNIDVNAYISNFACINNVPFHIRLVVLSGGGAQLYINSTSTPSGSLSGGNFNNQPVYLETYSSSDLVTYDNFSLSGTAANIPPNAPTNVNAIPGNGQVSLTWTAPNNNGSSISDYVVEYKIGSNSYSTFSDGVSTATSTIVTGLSNATTYTFRVSAVNSNGTSSPSATTTSTPNAPSSPTAPTASSVSISGTQNVGQTLLGNYTFSDVNGDSEGGSQYRWLRADTINGSYSAISGATSISYILTSSDLNKYIKFEVTPISTVAPTTGTSTLSSAIGPIGNTLPYINHILSTGQSLSEGYNGSPALTTTQPYNNIMLSGSTLVPLVESSVETMSSAMGNFLTTNSSSTAYRTAVTRHGVSSTAYSGLKKGTTPYNNGLAQVTSIKNAAAASSTPYRVVGVTTIHGESDHLAGTTKSQYEADLVEWQHDYESDVKAITGQSENIPLFTDQMSSQTGYNSATSGIPLAQLAATKDNPTKIYLVGPKYFFTYSDAAHLTNTSYRWLGEYYGKVMKKVLIDGQQWIPLIPTSINRIGNIIYADFNVPAGSLQFDTTNVSPRINYGFEYSDSSSSASISNVQLIDSDTVKITLNQTPTGNNQRLAYAYTGTPGANPGAQVTGSVGGNLRDTDTAASQYGNTLYDWAVQFNEPISADTISPVISSISVIPSQTTAVITWNTNEAASSTIKYGITSNYTLASTSPSLITSHSVTLTGLIPSTTYHYQISGADASSNISTSSDLVFITTVLPVIIPEVEDVSSSQGRSSAHRHVINYSTSINTPLPNGEGCQPGYIFSETTGNKCSVSPLTSKFMFTRDLSIGVIGEDVRQLQMYLNSHGFTVNQLGAGSLGNETTLFGKLTQAALSRFQAAHNILPSVGYFGPITRAKVNSN